jgi:hypothetical protein
MRPWWRSASSGESNRAADSRGVGLWRSGPTGQTDDAQDPPASERKRGGGWAKRVKVGTGPLVRIWPTAQGEVHSFLFFFYFYWASGEDLAHGAGRGPFLSFFSISILLSYFKSKSNQVPILNFKFMHKQNSSMGCKYNSIYLYPTYLNKCSHL